MSSQSGFRSVALSSELWREAVVGALLFLFAWLLLYLKSHLSMFSIKIVALLVCLSPSWPHQYTTFFKVKTYQKRVLIPESTLPPERKLVAQCFLGCSLGVKCRMVCRVPMLLPHIWKDAWLCVPLTGSAESRKNVSYNWILASSWKLAGIFVPESWRIY